jgi:hypothetical protein
MADFALAFGIGEHEPGEREPDELKIASVPVENDETGFVFVEVNSADSRHRLEMAAISRKGKQLAVAYETLNA